MRNRAGNKILSFVLAAVMLLGGVFAAPPMTAYAAGPIEMQEGLPNITVNTASATIVGFGGKQWAVIGYDGVGSTATSSTIILLLADGFSYGVTKFDSIGSSNVYNSSALKIAMETAYSSLSAGEMNTSFGLVKQRDLAGGSNYWGSVGYDEDKIAGSEVSNAYFWPLSVYEARQLDSSIQSYSDAWWLRSPGRYDYEAAFVSNLGSVTANGGASGYVGDFNAIRPAFKLNLSSVIFTSAAAGGKSKPTAVGASLSSAGPTTGAVKFTFLDTSMTLDVTATAAQLTQSGIALTFGYRNAATGPKQWVSCVLKYGSDVKYYGKLASAAVSSGTISIPFTGVPNGTYTLEIFSEQDNGDNTSDFAGNPVTLTVTVSGGSASITNSGTLTQLSNAGLASVAGQTITTGSEAGTTGAPKTASITVPNGNASIALTDIVPTNANATVELYPTGFSNATGALQSLNVGTNDVYIKVTAEDGTTELYYKVTVTRASVPAGPYTLNVVNGTDTTNAGPYAANTSVNITANAAPSGQVFDKWTSSGGGSFANEYNTSTTFTMPAANVTVTANYKNAGGGTNPDPDPAYTYRTLSDPTTGVTVTGYFAAGASLSVRPVGLHAENTCSACDEIRARQAAGGVIILYDISVSGGYSGNLTVSIPVGAQYNGQAVKILHCRNGVLESVAVTVENGIAKGTFSALSPFAVVKANSTAITGLPNRYTLYTGGRVSWTLQPAGGTWTYDKNYLSMTTSGDKYTFKALREGYAEATYTVNGSSHTVTIIIEASTIPQTGDAGNPLPWVLLILAGLCGIGSILLYRKKREHADKA